jgi:hypothetical protein
MRQFIIILQVVFVILLVLTLFVWLIAQGSSHNIPLKTNVAFGIQSLILVLLLISSIFIKRKVN